MFNDEDRDYGVLVLGVLGAVLLLIVGMQIGIIPGGPTPQTQTVAAAPASDAAAPAATEAAADTTAAATEAAEEPAAGTEAATEAAADTAAAASDVDLVAATSDALVAAAAEGDIVAQLGDAPDVIRLTGEVPSEEAKTKAGEIAAQVPGVSSVDNQLVVVAPAAASAGASLTATAAEDGTVVLTGAVPTDAEKTTIASAVAAALPPCATLDDQLTVDAATSMDGASLHLAGRARPALADALGALVNAGIPGLQVTVDNQIESVEAPKLETDMNALFAAEPIQFPTGSSTISAASNATIDKAAALLKATPDGKVALEGHTDNVGDPAKNQALSQARAEAVKAALVQRGVDGARLTATGLGAAGPIADNATAEGRAKNRRVEVVVTG